MISFAGNIGALARRRAVSAAAVVWIVATAATSSADTKAVTAADLTASELASAAATITSEDLQRHVDVLADDTFEGRGAGTRGGRAAAKYIGEQLQKRALRGAGDRDGYYQVFGGNFRNIFARIEGSDPKLRDQTIIVGAHFDHVGYGNDGNSYGPVGYIHNGADDNASGTAALMELIDAVGRLRTPPRRTIVFAFWDGEEQGLLGSKHWVARPTFPLRQVAATMNVDMIGRLRKDRLEVYGTRTAGGFRRLVSQANKDSDLRLVFPWDVELNSDHGPFFSAGIPIVHFHTGLHEDYHRPSDDANLVNAGGMQRIVRLMFATLMELAGRDDAPRFRTASRSETRWNRQRFERPHPNPPGRLGVHFSATDRKGPGVLVTRVADGSPAAAAGIAEGDRIVRIADRDVTGEDELVGAVLAAESPARCVVHRAGEEIPISVRLTGEPVRLGITWRVDASEPDAVALVQVIPGSPAARAGLRLHDRIYAVGGKPYSGSDDLFEKINATTGPLEFLVERSGRMATVSIRNVPPPRKAGASGS